jgi:hypothetical protein
LKCLQRRRDLDVDDPSLTPEQRAANELTLWDVAAITPSRPEIPVDGALP